MSDANRPLSRWSTSLSITTKSTGETNQTIPLVNVRRKLFRQTGNHPKTYAQRLATTKQNIEELFKLYYSNDIKFDTIQRQIVTGTRIPTPKAPPIKQNNLTDSSTNVFHSKHCVSREQISTNEINSTEQQPAVVHPQTARAKSAFSRRVAQTPVKSNSPRIPVTPQPAANLSTQQNELCDSALVRSVAFLGEMPADSPEYLHAKKTTSNLPVRPKSSFVNHPTQPVTPTNLNHLRKDPTVLSHTSFSTMTSGQPPKSNPPSLITGSALSVRPRSTSSKSSWSRQRTKSNLAFRTSSSLPHPLTKTSTPAIYSPLTIEPDMPEGPVYAGTQRVVSIPSRCSRYVLVTFPEVPLRYHAPSYVERLLLPERFPNLFQNIIHSYDPHLSPSAMHPDTT